MIITSSGDDAPLPLTKCSDLKGDALDAAMCNQVPKSDTNCSQLSLVRTVESLQNNRQTVTRTLSRAVSIVHGDRNPSRTSVEPDITLDGLEALRQAAQRAEARQWQSLGLRQAFTAPPASSLLPIYADPLSPLREQDLNALTLLFHRDDMHQVEADVTRQLLRLWPEPCWEDDPLDFLKEFL